MCCSWVKTLSISITSFTFFFKPLFTSNSMSFICLDDFIIEDELKIDFNFNFDKSKVLFLSASIYVIVCALAKRI